MRGSTFGSEAGPRPLYAHATMPIQSRGRAEPMPSKNKTLLIERLKTRKGRPREGLVLVEGVRCVREALAAEVKVRFAVRSPRLLDTEAGRALAADLSDRGVSVDEASDDDLERLADTEHPQGVLLVCEEPTREPAPLYGPPAGPVLLLDAIQDPGNLGTPRPGCPSVRRRGGRGARRFGGSVEHQGREGVGRSLLPRRCGPGTVVGGGAVARERQDRSSGRGCRRSRC